MSVEAHHACRQASPSSPTPWPHLETASLGVWPAPARAHEARREHGLAHLLEHMAFKGTKRRDARRIAEEIESAGGDLNAATSGEQTAYYARVLKDDVAARPRHPRRHPHRARSSTRTSWRARRTSSCRRSAPSRTRPTTSSSTCSARLPSPASRSAAASWARPRPCAALTAAPSSAISTRITARRGWSWRPPARVEHDPVVEDGRAAVRDGLPAEPRPRAASPATLWRRRDRRRDRSRAGQCPARLRGLLLSRRTTPTRSACSPTFSAAACPRACSRRCARSAACATRSMPSTGAFPIPALFGISAGAGPDDLGGARAGDPRRDRRQRPTAPPRPRSPAPRRR